MYNIYTEDSNRLLRATEVTFNGGGTRVTEVTFNVGGTWINSRTYDDMVLFASTVTALQTLLDECRSYAGPHDIVYKTIKTECMLVSPRQSQRKYVTGVWLGNDEFCYVDEFQYLEQVRTSDCHDNKDVETTIQEAKCSW